MSSIQRKLSAGLALSITIMWVVAMIIAGFVISHELDEASDSALRATASQLISMISTARDDAQAPPAGMLRSGSSGNPGTAEEDREDESDKDEPGSFVLDGDGPLHEELSEIDNLVGFVVLDENGTIESAGGHRLPSQLYDEGLRMGFSTLNGYRVYVDTAPGGQHILIADPVFHREETVRKGVLVLAYTLSFLIPLSVVSVWLIIRRSMRDLGRMQVQIESRGSNDLQPLATDDMPVELRSIGDSVNHLMHRLSRALESERNFATNSAHELRTPIASALSQIQRQIASLPEGVERHRAREIEKTLKALARLAEKLMQLARAESGSMVTDHDGNAFPVIQYLMDDYRSMPGAGSRLRLICTAEKQFNTSLDPDGMAILLRNLVDNALKYGDQDAPVDVIVDSEHNRIRVINEGPVITADELINLKQRFRRGSASLRASDSSRLGDSARAEAGDSALSVVRDDVNGLSPGGAGLGLAIAETITRSSGTELTLHSPARGRAGGFEACLQSRES